MNTDDVQILAEELGRTREKNKELERKLHLTDRQRKHAENKVWFQRWWTYTLVTITILGMISISLWVLTNYLISEGTADYCYIERESIMTDAYILRESIDWSSDRTIGSFIEYEDALERAETLQCLPRTER